MTGSSVYPLPSTGGSSQPPVNASSVLLDGQLVISGTYTTTIMGTGGALYLYANGGAGALVTISGLTYTVYSGTTVVTSGITGTQTVTVTPNYSVVAPGSFTTVTLPSSSNWYCAAGGTISGTNTLVVLASGSTAGAYSTNSGTSWTAMTTPNSNGYFCITYGNGYFVAGSTTNAATIYSTNGITWTNSNNLGGSAGTTNIVYGTVNGTGYFVASNVGTGGSPKYSTNNGVTWNNIPGWSVNTYFNIATNNGVVVGTQAYTTSTTTGAYGFYSSPMATANMLPGNYYGSIAYGNGVFVLVPYSSTTGAYSYNGYNWTTTSIPQSGSWFSTCYGNGYFVSVNQNSKQIMYSPNGIAWTLVSTSLLGQSVGYGNGSFIVVGNNSTATTSGIIFNQPISTPVSFGIYNGPATTY